MFYSAKYVVGLMQDHKAELARMIVACAGLQGECRRLETENTRLRSDLDWFKLHSNSMQRERAQLIHAAIGVKIAIPEFVPSEPNAADALGELPDLSRVGGDAVEDEPEGRPLTDGAVGDYSMLPGYERTK